MKYEKYNEILFANDYLKFEFISNGPKGEILKVIQFTPTQDESVMHLTLGNPKEDGSIDDLARDNNNDRNKILATVVSVLQIFFEVYPDKWVFFAGSTPERTRLYRMAITLHYEELSTDFEIVGLAAKDGTYYDSTFEKGIDYFAFLVSRKNLNL